MAPIFHTVTGSPPAFAVELAARALDVELTNKVVDMTNGEHKSPEFLKINPLGKVPALVDGGEAIWDSHSIITYLVNKYKPGHALYPTDPVKRSKVDSWLHYNNSMLDASQRFYYSTVFAEQKPLSSKPEKEVAFKAALKSADAHLGRSKFFAGDWFSLADIAVLGSLLFTEAWDYDHETDYPNIKRWKAEAIGQLPAYKDLHKENLEGLKQFLAFMKSQIKE